MHKKPLYTLNQFHGQQTVYLLVNDSLHLYGVAGATHN